MDVVNVRKRVDVFGNCREQLEHRLRILGAAIHQQEGRVLAVSRTTRPHCPSRYTASVYYAIPLVHAPASLLGAAPTEVESNGATGLNLAQRSMR